MAVLAKLCLKVGVMKEIKNKILITGAAGFIGYHLSKRLCKNDYNVIGLDNLNSYYDVNLKKSRLNKLKSYQNFNFFETDLIEREEIFKLFQNESPTIVIHLAAQAGVRYSITNPHSYVDSNLVGFVNILESCRHNPVKHLIYASSSSVYGSNKKVPFCESDNVDHPVSLYAATKKSNELMAHTYSNLYDIPTTGLRFFTVYGPFGRPDMAYFKFTKAIDEGLPIDVYNNGRMKRDFTYVDDIVEGIQRLISKPPMSNNQWDRNNPDPSTSFAPYTIYNIGNNKPVDLMTFIEILEDLLGKKAQKNFLEMQAGDVEITYANIDKLSKDISFSPRTSIEDGLSSFVTWYKKYYNKNSN